MGEDKKSLDYTENRLNMRLKFEAERRRMEEDIKRLKEEEAMRLDEEELMRLEEEEVKMLEEERAAGLDEEDVIRFEDEELMRLEDKRLEEEGLMCLEEEEELMSLEEEELMRLDDEEAMSLWEEEEEPKCLDEDFIRPKQAGPSHTQEGPSCILPGPSHTIAGPSCILPGPSHTIAGSSCIQPGPAFTQAGPSGTQNMCKLKVMQVRCTYCDKIFSTKANLKRHIKTMHEEQPTFLRCDHCKKPFIRKDNLQAHIGNVHYNKKPVLDLLTCSKCGRKFTSASNMIRHNRFSCPSLRKQPLLDNTGDGSADVNVAAETHEIELQTRSFECSYCKKVFRRTDILHRHINAAHNEDPTVFNCPHCGKGFNRKDALQRHIYYRHSDRKPDRHPCSKCGRQYVLKSSLARHQRLECGVPPQFSCPHCSYKASQKANLKRHMFRIHGFT